MALIGIITVCNNVVSFTGVFLFSDVATAGYEALMRKFPKDVKVKSSHTRHAATSQTLLQCHKRNGFTVCVCACSASVVVCRYVWELFNSM